MSSTSKLSFLIAFLVNLYGSYQQTFFLIYLFSRNPKEKGDGELFWMVLLSGVTQIEISVRG